MEKAIIHGFAEDFVTNDLLQKDQQPKTHFDSKVSGKVLQLDQPIPDFQARKELKIQKSIKRQKKTLNRKERKERELQLIPPENQNFQFFEPLHKLWTQYIGTTLDKLDGDAFYAGLLKCDLHGALITVVQSTCASNVGISGIVVKDTEQTFQIIVKSNALKVLAKKGNIFTVVLNGKVVTIYGDHVRQRPDDRITRKYKTRPTVDL